ncbi:MAG: hypothetical protein HY657_00270, partial [Acidobacteria bacterium]|nr:hypothetical protein [Acidobacteriota bacterium]
KGYSPASGARFLKRYIDKRVKLPLSLDWHQGSRFVLRVRDGEISVEAAAPRLVAAERTLAREAENPQFEVA